MEPIDEAEEMEWEPSMLPDASSESNLDCSSAKIFPPADHAGQVFVVPDTNVFLSSLICIKDIMEKGTLLSTNSFSIFVLFNRLASFSCLFQNPITISKSRTWSCRNWIN